MRFTNLAQVAEAAGVPYCRGIVNGAYCGDLKTTAMDHRRGFVRDGEVHMADRRINRSVIRAFCLLAADAEQDAEENNHRHPADMGWGECPVCEEQPPWAARFMRCTAAERIARERLKVRIPSEQWNLDRWTVRAQLTTVPMDHPLRAQALAWTRLAGAL